jgi:hypothetical protein
MIRPTWWLRILEPTFESFVVIETSIIASPTVGQSPPSGIFYALEINNPVRCAAAWHIVWILGIM